MIVQKSQRFAFAGAIEPERKFCQLIGQRVEINTIKTAFNHTALPDEWIAVYRIIDPFCEIKRLNNKISDHLACSYQKMRASHCRVKYAQTEQLAFDS